MTRRFRGVEVVGDPADEELVAQIAQEISSRGVELRAEDREGVRYRVYFPDGPPLPIARRFRALWRQYKGSPLSSLAPFEEAERDWGEEGRRIFSGTDVGPFWIGPPWAPAPPHYHVLRINPGRAFGTGLHPTTRIALRLLLPRITPGARVLDLGTGSGILALAALALGARDVTALDVDRSALDNARENVDLNRFGGRVRFVAGSVESLATGRHAFDPVLANLEYPLLAPLLTRLISLVAPEGVLVVSGVTKAEQPAFLDQAGEEGLTSVEEASEDGWWGAALAGR